MGLLTVKPVEGTRAGDSVLIARRPSSATDAGASSSEAVGAGSCIGKAAAVATTNMHPAVAAGTG